MEDKFDLIRHDIVPVVPEDRREPLAPEDEKYFCSLIGPEAISYLKDELQVELVRNFTKEKRFKKGKRSVFEFELGNRVVVINEEKFKRSQLPFLEQANAEQEGRAKKKVSRKGVSISFYFADKPWGGDIEEVRETLQSGTIPFLKTIWSFVQKIDNDVFITPMDKRRFRLYKKYFARVQRPRIFIFDLESYIAHRNAQLHGLKSKLILGKG